MRTVKDIYKSKIVFSLSGFITHEEAVIYEEVNCSYNKFWVPLVWANTVLTQCRRDGKIESDIGFRLIMEVILISLLFSGLIQQMTNWWYFVFYSRKQSWHFMQIVSQRDNLHGKLPPKRQFARNAEHHRFLRKIIRKKNASKCRLLNFLSRILSVQKSPKVGII